MNHWLLIVGFALVLLIARAAYRWGYIAGREDSHQTAKPKGEFYQPMTH